MKKNIAIIFTMICFFLLPHALMAGNILDKAGNPTATPITAYSLRLLTSSYAGNAIQVRRSSDNTTQNIGFTAAGDLDTAALKTFVGSGNGFVSIWYDQSGNGINATQSTTSNQPQIVASGVINRDNGKPAIYTSATGYLSYSGMSQFNGIYTATRMAVGRSRNGSSLAIIDGLGSYQLDCQMISSTSMGIQVNSGSIVVQGSVTNTNTLMAINSIRNNGASKFYINGVLNASNTSSIGTFGSSVTGMIGVRNDLGAAGPGAFSETILFNSVLSDADRQAIDNNQMNYYSLVNPLDKVGAPNAKPVTAFSLRQLGSFYTGKAIQVRRSSDNTTQDIGFTTAGDLDTAALKTFVGSGNGFVSIWYDQSGNGINATQSTNSNQPQIVASGVINRDNGKPAVYTSATGYLSYSGMTQFSGAYTATRMAVGRSRNGNSLAIIDGLGSYQLDCQMISTSSMGIQVNTGSIVVQGSVPNTNTLMAINSIRNNGASKFYINGALNATNTSSIGTFGSSVTGMIGVRNDLGAAGPGAFSETILFNSVLSDADRQAIDNNQINYYTLMSPLDKIGTVAAKPVTAFSLRQLGSNYAGKAIQVRRSSDNTTQDIGFTSSGDLDTTALRTFVGSGNGYVSIWYDQSGNGINATQTTTSNQPLIVTNGVINIDNGRPSIYTSANGYLSYAGMTQFNGGYQATRMAVARSRNGNSLAIIDGLGSYQMDCQMISTNSMAIQVNGGSILVNGAVGNTNAVMAVNSIRDNGASKLYVNGTLLGTNTSGVSAFGSSLTGMIGIRNDLGAGGPGAFSETILFNTVLSDADRQVIDSSQMKYFAVTNPLDKIGTLASNPAAAFSLRQLSTGYLGKAIQARRSSDNAVQDIGFTSAGDLDTAALKTFVGSGNGYVSTWYDQSGQKRDKTQPTATLQPQIVNAGVVYRKGGQPVIYLPATSGVGLIGAAPDYLGAGDVSVVLTAWSNSSTAASRRAIQGKTQNWLVGPYNNHSSWYGGGFIVDDANSAWKTTGEIFTVIEPANGVNDMYRNGLKVLNVSNAYKALPGSICVSAAGAFNEPMDGYMSELLEFNTALSGNDKDMIDKNTGGYNGIPVQANNLAGAWLPAIQPAEVFSLRQVNTGYAGPLVRIKAGGSYYDVYPDDDGNLTMNSYVSTSYTSYNADTTGITYNTLDSLIAGSVNSATVSTWYDQSGRGWNAIQATDANQPLLIQADTFVTAPGNNRPALLFSQSGKSYLQGDVHEINGFSSVTVNAICYQKTVNSQVLIGKDKVWNFILGTNGVNGAGSFNSSQNGTAWSDSVTRFVAFGLPSQNKVVSITGQYGNAGQTVLGNGIPLGSVSATLPALGSGAQPFQISGYGGASGANYWDGYIQEIVLTDSVLKSEDIRLLTTSQQSYYKTRAITSWTGASSQSWSDACNWSGGRVPGTAESIFIPAGVSQQPTIGSSVTAPDSLIVAPGATVSISSSGSFSGTAPKVILLASPSAAGYVINTAGASLGTTTIQKWMVGQQGFRVLAYPFSVSQSSFLSTASANNGLNLQLNSGSGSTAPSSSTPAIPDKTISDAQIFSANAWTNMVNGSASPNIPYALYYKGLATAFDSLTGTYGPSPFAFTVSGTTNTGTNVSIPAANSTTTFTMAGNPFTAPVTTLAMTGDATGNTSYYVWEIPLGTTPSARTTDAGQWVPYLPGNRLLPVMTAMAFKQATASSTISIPTSAMTTSGTMQMQVSSVEKSSGSSAKSNKGDESAMEYLELEVQEKGVYRDRLFVRYDAKGVDKGTDQADMEKLYNKGLNIYTLAEDKARLAVDFRREIVQPVPLGVRAAATGDYQFVVKKNSLWNANELYLRDNKLHTDTRLKNDAVYGFAIGEQEVGINERRFEIINKSVPEQMLAVTQNFSATLLGNMVNGQDAIRVMIQNSEDTQVSVELFNMQGAKLATKYVQSGEVDFSTAGLGAGMYVVRCTKKDKTIVLKLMK
ncbi:arabinofuranosidase catalytic domain-containing protein [Chitinophagaceae bacterium 26-R-25]|nr:arabinofuranosidase catalytic domain-containing protein [Chitinophagaceae bacterium 26-R-25]